MADGPVPAGLDDLDAADEVQCPICEEEFSDEGALAEHTTAEHG